MKFSNDLSAAPPPAPAQLVNEYAWLIQDGSMFVPYGHWDHPEGMQIFDMKAATNIRMSFETAVGNSQRTIAEFLPELMEHRDKFRDEGRPGVVDSVKYVAGLPGVYRAAKARGARLHADAFRLGAPIYIGHPDDRGKAKDWTDKKAYGWCTGVNVGEKGMTLNIEMSEPGQKLLTDRAFIYYSPYWAMEPAPDFKVKGRNCYRPKTLLSVGLVNNPNIPVPPMSNAAPNEEWKDDEKYFLGLFNASNGDEFGFRDSFMGLMNSQVDAQPSFAQRFAAMLSNEFDPSEERDSGGRWAVGAESTTEKIKLEHDKIADVRATRSVQPGESHNSGRDIKESTYHVTNRTIGGQPVRIVRRETTRTDLSGHSITPDKPTYHVQVKGHGYDHIGSSKAPLLPSGKGFQKWLPSHQLEAEFPHSAGEKPRFSAEHSEMSQKEALDHIDKYADKPSKRGPVIDVPNDGFIERFAALLSNDFDPGEARDKDGEWTAGGASAKLDPRKLDMHDQAKWLAERSRATGHASEGSTDSEAVNALAEKNPQAFQRMGAMWRARRPNALQKGKSKVSSTHESEPRSREDVERTLGRARDAARGGPANEGERKGPWYERFDAEESRLKNHIATSKEGLSADWKPEGLKEHSGGAEHEVWSGENGRIYKRTSGDHFGEGIEHNRGDFSLSQQASGPSDYLDRIHLQNKIFGDDIRLEGGSAKRTLGIATSQPHVKADDINNPHPKSSEVAQTMKDHGFVDTGEGSWYSPKENVAVADAKPDNFIKAKGVAVPIDLVMHQPQGELRKVFERKAASASSASNDRFVQIILKNLSNDANLDGSHFVEPVKATSKANSNMGKKLHEILGLKPDAKEDEILDAVSKMHKRANDADMEMENSKAHKAKADEHEASNGKMMKTMEKAHKGIAKFHKAMTNCHEKMGNCFSNALEAKDHAAMRTHLAKAMEHHTAMQGHLEALASNDGIKEMTTYVPTGESIGGPMVNQAPTDAQIKAANDKADVAIANEKRVRESYVGAKLQCLVFEKRLIPTVLEAEKTRILDMSNSEEIDAALEAISKRPPLKEAFTVDLYKAGKEGATMFANAQQAGAEFNKLVDAEIKNGMDRSRATDKIRRENPTLWEQYAGAQ